MRTFSIVLAVLLSGGVCLAQSPRPLDKVEVIRLLTNPLFAQSEVADVVRRSCVGFRPTERDWADLRNAGAGGEVIASVAACTARRSAPPPPAPVAPPPPVNVVAVTPEVVAVAGSPTSVRVFVHRGGAPQRRVPLTLGGTRSVGLSRDATAVTDDSGMAVFPLPPVVQPASYRFEILGNGGSTFPGRPSVSLIVRAGEPARLRIAPDYVASVERPATLVATVTDSLGNPLTQETVELSSGIGAPIMVQTDSTGRASFTLASGALPRGGVLQFRVRKLAAVDVPIADAAGLSGTLTAFVLAPAARRGRVGSVLAEQLVFRARTIQGLAPYGRIVRFRGVNARIRPDSAVLDSTGRVPLEVVLGTRAGEALVFATIDSVEKLVTFQVDPGPIAALVMEHKGEVVTGQSVIARVAAPFVLRVTARDFYGNETSIDALAQMMRTSRPQLAARQRYLEIVSLDASEAAVLITLKAQRVGTYDFTIGSGITASVRIDAVLR